MGKIKGKKYDFAFTVNKPDAYDTLKTLKEKVRSKLETDGINCDVSLVYYKDNSNSIRFYLKELVKKISLKKCRQMKISNAYAVIGNETFKLISI